MTHPAEPLEPRWWAEKQLWLMVAVLGAMILPRLGAIPFAGEEHRRVQVTAEMAAAGDWIVPREQGEIFFSRPPFQQWVLAASMWAFQSDDRWAARFPCALASLLTCVLLYGYSRQFVGRVGATIAGLAYVGGQVLVQAQSAETEQLFASVLSAALLIWHWGYSRKWPAAVTWMLAYGFVAAAALCKGGLQPPVYVFGPIGAFLLWQRDLRFAFSWGHLIGAAFGVALVAAWAIPCAEQVGWEATRKIWMVDTSSRFVGWKLEECLEHLVVFPVETLPCLLPWALALPAVLLPAVRRALAGCEAVTFCGLVLVIAVPTCWFPPSGLSRYLVPIYPFFAVLVGVLADRAQSNEEAARIWRRFVLAVAALLASAAIAVVVMRWMFSPEIELWRFILPMGRSIAYAVALIGLAVLLVKLRNAISTPGMIAGAAAMAAGGGLLVTGVYTDARVIHTIDIGARLDPILARLPADASIVVIGRLSAAARYHLRQMPQKMTPDDAPVVRPGAYFCIEIYNEQRRQLPFPWEEVAFVSLDRYQERWTEAAILIGRRLPRQSR